MTDRVPCAIHPANTDPTAELVLGFREPWSVFRVRGGFVAVDRERNALIELFPSKDAARAAVA